MYPILLLLLGLTYGLNWQENLRPKLFCSMTSRDFTAFQGNLSASDSFNSLLYSDFTPLGFSKSSTDQPRGTRLPPTTEEDGDILLIGAKNIIYKLVPSELRLRQTLVWPAKDTAKDTCVVKGKSQDLCQNFIVVMQQYSQDPSRFLFCGTNAFTPICREYVEERGSFVQRDEKTGLGLAPFDPTHNSTAVLVGEDLYAATVADFTGVDPIIFREPLRTQQYDSVQLNSPDFVGSFEHEDFVYFFFREAAVEYINCGKAVYSRVARVCKNDQGGPHKSKRSWTSFLKTRLNCSVPGEYPFYFDEIQSVSQLVHGQYASDVKEYLVYATFNTPVNSVGGSAVCAFRLRDVSDSFSGKFKEQRSISANWLPVDESKVPSPRPGTCINDTKSLPDQNLNFIKTHSLMDDPVLPFFGAPLVIRTGLVSRFTAIVVDPQVKTTDGKTFDVVFIGTTNGRVIKVINSDSANTRSGVKTVIIEELQVFSTDTIIKDLKVMGSRREGRKSLGQLAVMSESELRSFPVQRCDRASTCSECVALQDPYCAWELRSSRCSSGDWTMNMGSSFLQSVSKGVHNKCLDSIDGFSSASQVFAFEQHFNKIKLGQVVNIVDESQWTLDDSDKQSGNSNYENMGGTPGPGVQIMDPSQQMFSLEMLIITVSAGAVAALVVGFVTGYCCGRKCRKDDDLVHIPYPDTEYEYFEQRGGLARPGMMSGVGMVAPGPGAPLLPTQAHKIGDGRHEEVTYAEPELISNMVGGVSQMPPSQIALMNMPGGPGPNDPNNVPVRFPGESSHYSSSLLNPNNKFNTIHSSGNKRPLPSINHYESAAEAKLGSGKDPAYYARGRDNFNSYHMSTLGRSSSMRAKDPLLGGDDVRGRAGNDGQPLRGVSSSNSSSNNDTSSSNGKGHQVVDSAYGTTTRSAKKVYL